MSIHGIRGRASNSPPPPPADAGDKVAGSKRRPAQEMTGAHRADLPQGLPQRASDGVISPRICLPKLGPAHALATTVCAKVDGGQIPLRASYSSGTLQAAAKVAATGWMELARQRTAPP